MQEPRGELGAVPGVPGVGGFYRFAIGVKQAEIEVEAIGLMPAERAVRTGETTADGACGIEADQVYAFCRLADVVQYLGQFR